MVLSLPPSQDEISASAITATKTGAERMAWPDAGMTPFRGEKNTNWEGGYRVPALIRWPGVDWAHDQVRLGAIEVVRGDGNRYRYAALRVCRGADQSKYCKCEFAYWILSMSGSFHVFSKSGFSGP
jgi:hypothetical protein